MTRNGSITQAYELPGNEIVKRRHLYSYCANFSPLLTGGFLLHFAGVFVVVLGKATSFGRINEIIWLLDTSYIHKPGEKNNMRCSQPIDVCRDNTHTLEAHNLRTRFNQELAAFQRRHRIIPEFLEQQWLLGFHHTSSTGATGYREDNVEGMIVG
jgi:hypothetical protein